MKIRSALLTSAAALSFVLAPTLASADGAHDQPGTNGIYDNGTTLPPPEPPAAPPPGQPGVGTDDGMHEPPLDGQLDGERHHEGLNGERLDGEILSEEVSLNQIPAAARNKIMQEAGQKRIKSVERVVEAGKTFYKADIEADNGEGRDLRVDPKGRVMTERLVPPPPVTPPTTPEPQTIPPPQPEPLIQEPMPQP